jgi:hypothetical protein
MLHRASRTADSPTLGNVSEYRRYDVRGLRIFLVENLDVPRGGLKVAVAESVLHAGEVASMAAFQIRRHTSAPRYSVGSFRQAGDHSRADRPVWRRLRSRA